MPAGVPSLALPPPALSRICSHSNLRAARMRALCMGMLATQANTEMLHVTSLIIHYTQGSRLTFQLASPVGSDRFHSLAKTNFSLARRRHLLL